MKKNKIYIGGGFSEDQLLWIIPIISNYFYNSKQNIIYIENKLSKTFLESSIFKKYLKNFKMLDQNNLHFFKSKFVRYLFVIFKNFLKIFFFIFFVNRNSILKKKNKWFSFQFYHSFWDTSLNYCKDGQLEPGFLNKFIAISRCYMALDMAKKIHKAGVKFVFLGHTVYTNRALFAYLRSEKIKIFTQAAFNLHSQSKLKDNSWLYISKGKLSLVKKKVNINQINQYFIKRNKGKGNYYDSENALKGIKKNTNLKDFNTLFLHVFRDSPYNFIDKNRIFVDYFDWIIKTLKILKDSKEKWIIRYHPSHKRWGEDQSITLKKIINIAFNNSTLPSNIFIDEGIYSNLYLIKNSKKIVTFNGSVQLEAACFGKKVITIVSNFKNLNLEIDICPKNLSEYKKFLLIGSQQYSAFSKLNVNQILNSRYLLYIIENIHYLKKDLNASEIYRGDGEKLRKVNFKKIMLNIEANKEFFLKNSIYLKEGGTHTISKRFINYFIDHQKSNR